MSEAIQQRGMQVRWETVFQSLKALLVVQQNRIAFIAVVNHFEEQSAAWARKPDIHIRQ